jgi:hypothetical protein
MGKGGMEEAVTSPQVGVGREGAVRGKGWE